MESREAFFRVDILCFQQRSQGAHGQCAAASRRHDYKTYFVDYCSVYSESHRNQWNVLRVVQSLFIFLLQLPSYDVHREPQNCGLSGSRRTRSCQMQCYWYIMHVHFCSFQPHISHAISQRDAQCCVTCPPLAPAQLLTYPLRSSQSLLGSLRLPEQNILSVSGPLYIVALHPRRNVGVASCAYVILRKLTRDISSLDLIAKGARL